jgi:hypothetical protein
MITETAGTGARDTAPCIAKPSGYGRSERLRREISVLRTITDHPPVWLGHLTSVKSEPHKITYYYGVSPLDIHRPDFGSSLQTVTCHTCAARVQVRVDSIAPIIRKRRLWLVLATAGIPVGVGSGWFGLATNDLESAAVALLSVVGAVAGLLVFIIGLIAWWAEHGVKITPPVLPGHKLLVKSAKGRPR